MKQRIETPVFTWFLVAAVLFSALTFLLGIWVCSNAPRSGYGSEEDVPTVVEHPEDLDMDNTLTEKPNPVNQTSILNEESGTTQPSTQKVQERTSEPAKLVTKTPNKSAVEKVTPRKIPSRKLARQSIQKKSSTATTSTIQSEKIYYIQLTATVNRKMAEKMKRTYAGKGYNMYLITGKKHGNTLYKVRIGVFKDWKKAKAIAEKIRREDKLKPWIIAM